jgi:hypothetical protein
MIATIFVIVALIIIFVVEAVLTEVEAFGWATVTLVTTGAAVHFLHVVNLFDLVRTHVVETILFTLGYLGVGVAWSFIKWFSFLIGFRDTYRQRKESFFNSLEAVKADLNPESKINQEVFHNSIKFDRFRDNELNQKPMAIRNKGRIMAWMSFWPFSMAGTIINDPIRRLFNFLFNQFKALYQKMSDKVFASHPELK